MKSSFCFSIALFFVASQASLAEPITQSATLMGKKLSVTHQSDATVSQQGVTTETQVQFLGKQRSLIEASIEAVPEVEGNEPPMQTDTVAVGSPTPVPAQSITLAKTDLYIGGVRVWNGSVRVEKGGIVYSGGVAPTQIPFPIFAYPVGPLLIQVDAGIEFEGEASASVLPGISIPIQDMSIDAKLEANLYAAGYVEGYAKLLFVRAGVGGRVNLIEGRTGVAAHLYFNGTKPQTSGFGQVTLLNGRVYAFVDSNLLFGGWKRWFSKDFYKWPGQCFALGEAVCASH